MELGQVSATYEGLKDLILREQFLTVSDKKERKIKSIKEMVELAEQYNEAHSVSNVSFDQHSFYKTDFKSDITRKDYSKDVSFNENEQSRGSKERLCYRCGKKDHFIKSCPVLLSLDSLPICVVGTLCIVYNHVYL